MNLIEIFDCILLLIRCVGIPESFYKFKLVSICFSGGYECCNFEKLLTELYTYRFEVIGVDKSFERRFVLEPEADCV